MLEVEILAAWTESVFSFSFISAVLNQSLSRLLCETYPMGSHKHAGEHPSIVSSLSALGWSWTTPIISRAVLNTFVFLDVLFFCYWQIYDLCMYIYIYIAPDNYLEHRFGNFSVGTRPLLRTFSANRGTYVLSDLEHMRILYLEHAIIYM